MNPASRRRLGWKILGGILGVLAVIVGVAATWTTVVAGRCVQAMEEEVAGLRSTVDARNPSRRPLRGEPLKGDAWVDYDQALAAMPRAERNTINQVYSQTKVLSPEKLAELIASGEGAFEHFRRGTRRAHGAYPFVWEDGVTGKSPPMYDCQTLANFAAIRARRLVQEGKTGEAAELMLDVCRFGQDLSTNSFLIYHAIAGAIYHIALNELWAILGSEDLSAEELRSIERQLEQLGKEWPDVGEALAVDALAAGYELLKPRAARDPETRA